MYQKEATEYVRACLKNGMKQEQIKNELINAGYSPSVAMGIIIEQVNKIDEEKNTLEYSFEKEKTKLMTTNVTIVGIIYILMGLGYAGLGLMVMFSGNASGAINGMCYIGDGILTVYIACMLIMLRKAALYLTYLSIAINILITIIFQWYWLTGFNLVIGYILFSERKNFR